MNSIAGSKDYANVLPSAKLERKKVPLVSPLTTKPLTMRKNVVHRTTLLEVNYHQREFDSLMRHRLECNLEV